ncbi:MAG TPA: carbon-nitrogen hydrolase family protein [Bryobacteraceae bacterium]|nr:carbon-nitrogen hydrolase family protein [Bryobacteraceae bacterium]
MKSGIWLTFLAALLLFPGVVSAAPLHIRPEPSAWTTWAPRPEIMPRTFVDRVHARSAAGSLAISGNSNPAAWGGWVHTVSGIQPGTWYHLSAWYRTEGVQYERGQVLARINWVKGEGRRAGQPEYVYASEHQGEWTRLLLDAPAPTDATGAQIQLFLANAPTSTVWWDEVSFDQIDAPAPRKVIVESINYRPSRQASSSEVVGQFLEQVDRLTTKADIILLPEGITVVNTGKKYADVAEPVPGPTTARLGEMARKKHAYIVAGIFEREGTAMYNTAVLIDRAGQLLGKYRKVYLPREELEGGLTPGSDYPVFQTDFGKVGMMICWDLQYADPARNLTLRGAELILMPIWGGSEPLGKARAIENQVFLASSGYDYPTYILDPNGEVLSVAQQRGTAATATIDLNKRYLDAWLGNMHQRFQKEVRLDLNNRY